MLKSFPGAFQSLTALGISAVLRAHWPKLLGGVLLVAAVLAFVVGTPDDERVDLLVQPKTGPFQVAVTTTGELRAKNSVKINGPRRAQQVRIYQMKIQRLVPEGTVVEQGDFVAEIDQSELNSKIQDAQIEMEKAQSQYEQTMLDTLQTLTEARNEQINLRYAMEEAQLRRDQSRYEAPSVKRQAEIDFEKAKRAYEQAVSGYETQVRQSRAKMREVEASLSKARKDLTDLEEISQEFRITAPENGMVIYTREWGGRKITAGSTVNAWNPVVAELPDLSVMESVTYVNEVDIQKLREGQDVEIGLDAAPGKALTGSVTHVANIGEQRPGSDAKVFEVTVLINEADTTLRPAMSTSNAIIVAEVPEAMYVPLETIHAQDSLTYVYLRRSGGAIRQEVRLGLLDEDEVIVTAGLEPDDRVYLSVPADTAGLAWRLLEPEDEPLARSATP